MPGAYVQIATAESWFGVIRQARDLEVREMTLPDLAGSLLNAVVMLRIAIASCGLLAACSLYFTGGDDHHNPQDTCAGDAPPGSCQCSNGTWFCTTCPFFEGTAPAACSQPGESCQIETWEHGCDCTCGSDGYWACFAETIGSQCPHAPYHDAAIDSYDAPPDAVPIDAAPCSRIEAENIGDHLGWDILSGSLSGGFGLINTAMVALHFNFTGTTLAINRELGPNAGPLAISIDGGAPIVIQGTQSTFSFVTLPVASGLANTQHQASLVCESEYCSLDYFDVSCH
jgi:hypothetical protein